jgi:antitoxin ParD1/3/4
MEYINASIKFPKDLDESVQAFISETGFYSNRSEFVKEACRWYLYALTSEGGPAAISLEQRLELAETAPIGDEEFDREWATIREMADDIDDEALEAALDEATDRETRSDRDTESETSHA